MEVIPDTEFRLDGGAMFGVVPKTLWERVCPADELNRVRLNMNCLFIEGNGEKILIETGIGEKWDSRSEAIFGITRARPLARSLSEIAGCGTDEITIVVNTHLHFDHCGGNTVLSGDEEDGADAALKPQFPNARYLVPEAELNHAEMPSERDRASYLEQNWKPLIDSGQLETMPSEYEVIRGVRLKTVRGHSSTMQTVCVSGGGETIYGFADLVPTTAHLPLPWIMGYDLFPTETLEAKRELLSRALKENWICLFYHDPETPLCRLRFEEGTITAEPL